MIMQDPRPYFYTDEYAPKKCDFEYGSPSGHSQAATSFFLTFVTLLLRENPKMKYKFWLYFGVAGYCAFVAFTRIFVGLHTAEQILLGYGFGLIFHLLIAHIFYDNFERLFTGIEAGRVGFLNPIFYLYLTFNIIVALFYVGIDSYYPAPQLWLDTIMKS